MTSHILSLSEIILIDYEPTDNDSIESSNDSTESTSDDKSECSDQDSECADHKLSDHKLSDHNECDIQSKKEEIRKLVDEIISYHSINKLQKSN
jgi:hypothetical protein